MNIKCVDAVVALVSLLERSVLCSGNADNKFSAICDAHKGHFRDKTGKPVLNNKQWFIVHSGKTIHTECEVIITDNIGDRCKACDNYRYTK